LVIFSILSHQYSSKFKETTNAPWPRAWQQAGQKKPGENDYPPGVAARSNEEVADGK
jgi:hypothetical protein